MKKIVFSAFAIIVAGGFMFLKDAGKHERYVAPKKKKMDDRKQRLIEVQKDTLYADIAAFQ